MRFKQRDAGVDFVVATGTEAGGRTGYISTMVLLPQIVDGVAPLPVLAAGGIGRGRQVAAAPYGCDRLESTQSRGRQSGVRTFLRGARAMH
jgi:hypothetical protein